MVYASNLERVFLGFRYIHLDDFLRFLSEEESERAMALFEGASETLRISKSCLKNWVVSFKLYMSRFFSYEKQSYLDDLTGLLITKASFSTLDHRDIFFYWLLYFGFSCFSNKIDF